MHNQAQAICLLSKSLTPQVGLGTGPDPALLRTAEKKCHEHQSRTDNKTSVKRMERDSHVKNMHE
jgi:hypothetical protein